MFRLTLDKEVAKNYSVSAAVALALRKSWRAEETETCYRLFCFNRWTQTWKVCGEFPLPVEGERDWPDLRKQRLLVTWLGWVMKLPRGAHFYGVVQCLVYMGQVPETCWDYALGYFSGGSQRARRFWLVRENYQRRLAQTPCPQME